MIAGTLKIIGTWYLILLVNLAYAQGVTIPSGSTVNVNTGTLNVAGNIPNSGTLQTTTGTVSLSGDWTNTSGTYTSGTGTLGLTKSSGTQTVISGGTAVGKKFYNLTHSGAGTAALSTDAIDVDNNFTNSAGTFNAAGLAMTIGENWSNSGTFTANANTVTFDGTTQTISGSTTFATFSKIVSATDTLTFQAGTTQTISTSLTMQGAALNLLSLRSGTDGTEWFITLSSGGLQSFQYLDVKDSNASGGLTLVAGATSTNSLNNTNWVFGAATLTWQGDISSNWSTAGNWNLGFVPTSADTAIVPDVSGSGGSQPTLTANVTVTNLTVSGSTSSMSLGGFNLTVSSTLSNDGNINLFGSETVSIGTVDSNSGTFTFTGDNDGVSENFNIPDLGGAGTDYYNMTFNDTHATARDTFRTTANLTAAGAVTVSSGTLDISTNANTLTATGTLTVAGTNAVLTATNGNIDANGNVTISSGTFTAPTTAKTFTIAGNFTHSGGTFTNSSGTVTLDGTSQSLTGNTTFYNLTKSVTSAATLTFDDATTQTISNALTLTGASGQLLSIRSDNTGTQAAITLSAGGTQNISFVDVQDSNASGGLTLIARNSTSLVNTTGWALNGTMTWQGDDGTTPTNWDTATNWDLGTVPIAGDTAIIADVANDPTLAAISGSGVTVANLTLNTDSVLTLGGKNVTVTSTFANSGTITLIGNETVTVTQDTDSGTFNYVGNNTATARTIIDFGSTDYYNLTINGTGGTPDTFSTSSSLTTGNNLNVTLSTLTLGSSTTLTTTGTLTVNGGTLTATSGSIDANGIVTVSSGTLTAPNSSGTFTIADDFTHSGGTFTHSSGTVTLDTTTTATITGSSTFNNLTSTTAGKEIDFTASSTQTINGTLTLTGISGSEIILRSTTTGTRWNFDFPGGTQTVQFLNVRDGEALSNNITCFTCTNVANNDDGEAAPHWIFLNLSINVPQTGKTTDRTPTVIGVAPASTTIEIRSGSCGGTVYASSVTSDASGNFRVENESSPLSVGSHTLVPCLSASPGGTVTITTVASPTSSQQPTITSHTDGTRINGANPTISGAGLASQTATIVASDTNGNLLLSTVATGSTDTSGNYAIILSTALPKGTNSISVTVSGVASDILTVSLTDPFGVVFDSITNNAIENAVVSIFKSDGTLAQAGVDLDSGDTNPLTTSSNGIYSFIAINGNYYLTVTAAGYSYPSTGSTFPAGRTITTGSKQETFTVAGVVLEIDLPMDPTGNILRLVKDANKNEARVGDVVTYTITVQNQTPNNILDVFVEDKIPPGFKFIDGHATRDGDPIGVTGNRPLVFSVGNMLANSSKTLKYQLVVGSGVTVGNYENKAFARYSTGQLLSNTATETVKVVMDPLFDLGAVIGKVFFDKNENGIQDEPKYVHLDRETIIEEPVPHVQIVMEDGTVITTDKDGKFNLPGIIPGRHLFRLDERSLPEGSYLTTDKVVVVDVTQGATFKVNFGVSLDYNRFKSEDQAFFTKQIKLNQDKNKPTPRLTAAFWSNEVAVSDNIFTEKAQFRIFTNYSSFIEKWKLEIIDKDTKKSIRTFEGDRFNIHDPIFWDGKDKKGEYIRLDRNYVYFVTVEGKDGKYDETKPLPIQFKVFEDAKLLEDYLKNKEADYKGYLQWLQEKNRENNLAVQSMAVDGETITLDRLTAIDLQAVRILKDNDIFDEVPILEKISLTARDLLEGKDKGISTSQDQLEIILPKGDYQIVVQEKKEEKGVLQGEAVQSGEGQEKDQPPEKGQVIHSYSKSIKVGDDYFFFVAMGDAKAGYTIAQGNIEPVQHDDKFQQGFWLEGKMAYYLKGKVLGKYLVTSSFDTERDKKEIFKSIDPNKYYPLYGDASSKNYSATDTQGNLYLLVEWDRSSALWGNYSVEFTDTEFAQFSRSLYGGKVDYKTVSATQFGEPHTQMVVFQARAQQKAAHNEFLSTGGSLYYLKHNKVIEGSDKINVQIRDRITGLVLAEREMKESADYEMDYDAGRILFWRPVPFLVQAYSIISNELLAGNPVYVIVDYEYEPEDKFDQANVGSRIKQAITDYVQVGGTYVRENQETADYELKGTDVAIRLGQDATVKAEYAETKSDTFGTFISTDGGLSFTEISTNDQSRGRAYSISGDARLFNRLGLSSYYKWIDPDFSTASTTSQQGKEVMGYGLTYDIADDTRLVIKQDTQTLLEGGNLQTQAQVGATTTTTTLLQLVHDIRVDKLTVTAEYKKQAVTDKLAQFETETNKEEDILALQADYQVDEKTALKFRQQVTLDGVRNDQSTLGITTEAFESIKLDLEQTFGLQGGTATRVGIAKDVDVNINKNLTLIADYQTQVDQLKQQGSSASVGAIAKVDDLTDIRTSLGLTDNIDGSKITSLVLGGSSKVDETTTQDSQITFSESTVEGKSTQFSFGTKKKINEELEVASTKSFGVGKGQTTTGSGYGLVREKDGRKLEGSLTRQYSEGATEISRSNIFGLKGDIDERWAVEGTLEKGEVQNLNGTRTERTAMSVGAGYVYKDPETLEQKLKGSSKLELRLDDAAVDKRQFLFYGALEGQLIDELYVFSKMEFSQTKNLETDVNEAEYKEMQLGAAYRPINYDRLNLLGRYTYQENKAPSGQANSASQSEEYSAHTIAGDLIYDLNERWQWAEKFGYRIADEKVTGFDFVRTHTWLLIQRLSYKIDTHWSLGGEYRILTQQEAQDAKRGFLMELAYKVGDFGQLGLGYNFTDFSDDLTDLDYFTQGPFVRMTGKIYDRTPAEIERAKEKWLEEKINYWAWLLVNEEMRNESSPILQELNEFFLLADEATRQGKVEEARQVLKDLITAGEMMYQEAAEYIRARVFREKKLQEMDDLADQYFKKGQYEKAKKIWEKIVEEIQNDVIK